MDPLRRALSHRFLSHTRHYQNVAQVRHSVLPVNGAPPYASYSSHEPATRSKKIRNPLRSGDAVNSETLPTVNKLQCTSCGDQFYDAFTLSQHLAAMPKDHSSFQQFRGVCVSHPSPESKPSGGEALSRGNSRDSNSEPKKQGGASEHLSPHSPEAQRHTSSRVPEPTVLNPNDSTTFAAPERVHTGKLVHSTTPDAWKEISRTGTCRGSVSEDQSYDSLPHTASSLEFAFFMASPDRAMFPFSSYPKQLSAGSPIKLIGVPVSVLLKENLSMFYVGSTPTQFGGNSYRNSFRSHVTFVRNEDVPLAQSLWERIDKRGNRILYFDHHHEAVVSTKVFANGRLQPHTVQVSFLGGLSLAGPSNFEVYAGTKLSFSNERVHCPSPDCDFYCHSASALKRHYLAAKHVDGELFSCGECNKAFDAKSKLALHFSAVHRGEKEHQCVECTKSFAQKSNLDMHVASVHLRSRGHACDECEKAFSQRSKLLMHIASVHKVDKPHACGECGMTFSLKPYLRSHVAMVHDRERTHQCTECEKSFFQTSDLARHMAAVHTEARDHVCGECEKAFALKSHLNAHVASVHRGHKPHRCTYQECGSSFAQASELRRHVIGVHLRVRAHQCEQCDRGFSQRSDLTRHVIALH